jgi:hypothetical protein
MGLNKLIFQGALLSFFGLLLSAEVFLRTLVPSGFWYHHFDFSGDMTSLAEIQDRIRYSLPPEPGQKTVFFLGDSVLGSSALLEHKVPQARQNTLSRFLQTQFQGTPNFPLSLGSDGLLLPDIEALAKESEAHPPALIVLLLNFRMFAQEYARGSGALSRDFLLQNLPPDIQKQLIPEQVPSEESRLSAKLYAGLCGHWFLFRETQMLKTLWFYPSPKDFFQRILEKILGEDETLSEIAEAALKLKTAAYYQAGLWDPQSLPFECLKRTLDQWAAQKIHVTILLTPQNRAFLGPYLDLPSFNKNRKILASFLKAQNHPLQKFQDWSDRYPSSYFLDHCHLKPEGNEQYAKDLTELLAGVSK